MGESPVASFPIVAVGASAGGLTSLQCFLSILPKKFGFAVVFMQHLSPKHKSLLPELLRNRRPGLDINEISDGMKVLPGKLYLCPPGKEIKIMKTVFQVSDPSGEHFHLPIDEFFSSLAEEAGERAIAVIFSGAGTDGARGVQAIRNAGGTVFVQDPETAEFPAMPAAAIGTGQADGVLPPDDIAREILKIYGSGTVAAVEDVISPEEFNAFYRVIQEKTGLRFEHYKKSVVGRRIRRRMFLRGVSSVADYIKILNDRDAETAALASDLMIGVTSFFRDRLAWKALKTGVIRKLTALDEDSPVRVWCPACATGEEAYSIAMMLQEEFDLAGRKRDVQVFATDVSEQALEKAREGKYPGSIAADVAPEYMRRFFTCSDDGLSVIIGKETRERVIFAKQDLLTDPPFSKLDLVICRNLLIYLEPVAQEKCLALFHYALKGGGYLFLGNAESVGRNKALFRSLSHKKCRIYQKVDTGSPSRLSLTVPFASERATAVPPRHTPPAEWCMSAIEIVQETLLGEFAPAAVAIDQGYDILYHNGPTNRYLRQPRGAPTQNFLELLPDSLRNRVRGAIYRATQESRPVSIRTSINGDDEKKRQVTLRISTLRENLFLVVFREKGGIPEQAVAVAAEVAGVDETAVRQLEGELAATRAELQTNIEQLKSLNEELQSSNEELQAANEELETSREELQSLNEELITVNSQLQSKVEEQEETNNDLNNFLASTNIPTIFLDHQFRVKRFTPAMSRLIKLIPSDVSRPIIDMSQEGLGPELIADAQAVLEQLAPVKKEMAINGTWYVRTALPYRTSDDRIEGVVITYNDVTEIKKVEERTRHLASFPELNPNPILELDSKGTVAFANPAAQKVLEELGMNRDDYSVFLPADIEGIISDLVKNEEAVYNRELTIKDRVFAATIYLTPRFKVARIYVVDITGRKRAENVMQARLRLATVAYSGDISADEVLRLTLDELETQTGSVIGFYHFLEADQETLSLQNWSTNTVKTMCNSEGKGSHYNISQAGVWVDCVRERRPVIHNEYASLPHRKGMPEGHAQVIREMVIPIMRGERIVAIIGVGNKPTDYHETDVEIALLLGDFSWEIVERKRSEEALRGNEKQYRELFENMIEGFAYCKMVFENGKPQDFIYLSVNHAFETLTGLKGVVGKRVTEVIPGIREADPELIEIYGRVSLTGKPERFEMFVETLKMWFSISVYSPEKEFFVAIFDVITERKQAEAELQRLNKALKALSDSSQAVIRAKDETEYLNEVCRLIVEDCGYNMVWIGFAENDEEKSVRPVAHAGFEDGYLETLQITWADTERGQGPTGTAIRTGKVAMCRNMLTDPAFAPWREQAVNRGYASSIVFPLPTDDRVIGAITIYSKEADPFSEGEMKLLTELADNLAYGIEVLRIRVAQKQAEDALRESEERVRRKLDSILSPGGGVEHLELSDIFDTGAIQSLMEDFYKLAHIPMAIIDLKGKVLVGVGWQEICLKFHRIHPETCKHCIESDTQLSASVPPGEFKLYKCKNNMWDVVTPIMVGGQHVGNFFTGQFFFEDEPTDSEFFRMQARQYGFDEEEYLAALEKVPRLSRESLDTAVAYYMKFSEMLSKLSFSNLKLAGSLAEQKRAEEDVLKLSEDMAARNVELEMVNKELESFIYSISHDLRAPIRTISGFARIIVEDYAGRLDEQGKDYLSRILRGAEKMTRLIDDLLQLSKISRHAVGRTEVGMSKIASSIVAELRESDPGRSVEVDIAEGLTAFADPRLIGIVLSNLLGNAWKFTSKTENARIEFGPLEQDGKIVFFVKDNGAGFNPEYTEKMFWPFHRLHSDKEFEGTGIGLTIVERIIHRHGGKVWAEGEKGKGATIYFTLK